MQLSCPPRSRTIESRTIKRERFQGIGGRGENLSGETWRPADHLYLYMPISYPGRGPDGANGNGNGKAGARD
jgi:hypothetical protein